MKKKKTFLRIIIGSLKFCIQLFLLYTTTVIIMLFFFRFVNPASTAFIFSNIEEPLKTLFTTEDVKNKPVSIDKVSAYAPLAVVASEDQRFFDHYGFDLEQIEKAMKENTRRKRIRGASTITMQVAKNLFLWPGKNILRKGMEAYYTLLIELCWSKKRIIEVYLNIAEMGSGIYGVEQAAMIFYNKNSYKLTASESATLAAILPSPKRRNPARPSSYVIGRRARIMEQMNLIGGTSYIKKYIY